MTATETLAPNELKKLIKYDAETGVLTWCERPIDYFRSTARHSQKHYYVLWNRRFAGKRAFTAVRPDGYAVGAIFSRLYRAHRVAWCLFYGEWPDIIDHINHDRGDNRIANLRSISSEENYFNLKKRINNTSGHCGVTWYKAGGTWQPQIQAHGESVYLGRYANLDEAVAVRKAAEQRLGFHENHGK